jgi:hypothetical protein
VNFNDLLKSSNDVNSLILTSPALFVGHFCSKIDIPEHQLPFAQKLSHYANTIHRKDGTLQIENCHNNDKCTTSYTLRMVDEEILIYDSFSSTSKMSFTCWFLKIACFNF